MRIHLKIPLLVALSIGAFAGNSLLCRLALRDAAVDPSTFTGIRLLAGAATLWALLRSHGRPSAKGGNWTSAWCLFLYAAGFSAAYTRLQAGVGALLLFGAVQVTMYAWGMLNGERLRGLRLAGVLTAFAGLLVLLNPQEMKGVPELAPSLLMLAAGVAWGVYSLRGKCVIDAFAATRGNFVRAAPLGLVLMLLSLPWMHATATGMGLAIMAGAVTSALGYVAWYSVTPCLNTIQAASVQLAAPVLTALVGIALLGEHMSTMQWCSGAAVVAGIWLASSRRPVAPDSAH